MLACAPPQKNAEVVRLLLKHNAVTTTPTAREKMQPLHYVSTPDIAYDFEPPSPRPSSARLILTAVRCLVGDYMLCVSDWVCCREQ